MRKEHEMPQHIRAPPEGWVEQCKIDGHSEESMYQLWSKQMTADQRNKVQKRSPLLGYANYTKHRPVIARPDGFLPLPVMWVAEQRARGLSQTDLEHLWKHGMTQNARRDIARLPALRAATVAAAQAKIDHGTADSRAETIVRQGGYRLHSDAAAAKSAALESKQANRDRLSLDRLAFRKLHAAGCIEDGCPLSGEQGDVLLPLLQHDHRDDTEKVGTVTALWGEERMIELQKTGCKCLWHHFLHTRVQMNYGPASKRRDASKREFALLKERTGCQHPCHERMPYTSLVPSASDDPLMYGFLHVSHVFRCLAEKRSDEENLLHLQTGVAVIHCHFCHALWTALEDAATCTTPLAQHNRNALLEAVPSFVMHFDQTTHEFDWSAARAQKSANITASQLKRFQSQYAEQSKRQRL